MLTFLLLAYGTAPAVGQNTFSRLASKPPAQPIPVEFVTDLNVLAQRWKVAFVAEGQPQTVHADAQTPVVQGNVLLEDAVKQLAYRYDYTAVRRGRVFQLTRNYTNAGDIPDVTPEECRQSLDEVVHQMALYNQYFAPEDRNGDPMAHISHLLSRQQLETLSGNGLSTDSLSPIQKAEVWRIALYFFLQNQSKQMVGKSESLSKFSSRNMNFRWQDVDGIHAFGYETITEQPRQSTFIALSHLNKTLVAVNGVPVFTSTTSANGVPINEPDSGAPDAKVSVQSTDVTVALAQVMAILNERVHSKSRFTVDSGLSAKHITLVGAEQADSSEIMNAMAAVYNLRVLHLDDGAMRITRPRNPSAQDISELGTAVRNAIPTPIWRTVKARVQAMRPLFKTARTLPQRPIVESDYHSAAENLREATLREFRAQVEPKTRKAKDQKLPFSALTDHERQLFTIAFTAYPFAEACWIADRPIPPYIADFEHVVLTGGVIHDEKNGDRFSLFFSYPDPATGQLHRGVGFTNARIPKE